MIPRVRPTYTLADLWAALAPARGARHELERALAQEFGMRAAILFPYGRSAIYGVLRALEVRGEVVQPAYNCVVVAHAAVVADCAPVFVDCGREDPNQDAEAMIAAVNEHTGAVIPTSIFGHTFDACELGERIRRRNKRAVILMDCAQAFTAKWQGELLAEQGDAAVLAFGIGKAMTTLFGGAVLTNRADVAEKIRAWQNAEFREPTFGHILKRISYFFASWTATTEAGTILADRVERSRVMASATVQELRAREAIRLPAANQMQLTAQESALGLSQLPRLGRWLERRRALSSLYEKELRHVRGIQLPRWQEGATHTIYTVALDAPQTRANVLAELRRRGVQGGTVLDYVVPDLECYRARGYGGAFPNARAWAQRALNLPNHPALADAQARYCARALRAALEAAAAYAGATGEHVREFVSR